MQFCGTELCASSLHSRSQAAKRRGLQPRQHLLPLSGHSAGTLELPTKSSPTFLNSHPTLRDFFGQYLFMQGRIENIFTDPLYNQFTVEITDMLRLWRPKLSPSGKNLIKIPCFYWRFVSFHHGGVAFMLYPPSSPTEKGSKHNITLTCAAQLTSHLPPSSVFVSHIQMKGEAESWKWAELLFVVLSGGGTLKWMS